MTIPAIETSGLTKSFGDPVGPAPALHLDDHRIA
jgi:hypothetical protein